MRSINGFLLSWPVGSMSLIIIFSLVRIHRSLSNIASSIIVFVVVGLLKLGSERRMFSFVCVCLLEIGRKLRHLCLSVRLDYK